MRRVSWIVLTRTTTLSLMFVWCGRADAQQRMGLDPAPRELRLAGDVVVPMQRFHGWAVVDARVNGKGPFRFVIDTGAPGLFVDDRAVDAMGLAPDPQFGDSAMQIRVAGPGGGEGLPARLLLAQSLVLGKAELRELRTVALKLPFPREFAGVIGMGVFKDCLLTLDYPGSRVMLSRGELPPADGREILEFTQPRQRGSHPVLPIKICGKSFDVTLDTGMTGWMTFSKPMSEACPLAFGPIDGPKARAVDREMTTRLARIDGDLTFGGYTFRNPHGRIHEEGDLPPLLGSRILQEFSLTLDQKNKRIRFARDSRTPIAPPSLRAAGFSLSEEDDRLVVWSLMPDSPAARAGIEEGDVVALNGKPAGDIYARPVWDKLLQGDVIRVRYKPSAGSGEAKDVDVAVSILVP